MIDGLKHLQRVCVKLYAAGPDGISDETFVPIFHEWIRDRSLDGVLLDVADYTHVPDGPGVVLVTHAVSFSLDRSDGRFGLLAQRRRPVEGDAADAIAATLRGVLSVAEKLEADPRLSGRLAFDRSSVRVEANDRLSAPNTDAAFEAFEPFVCVAVARVFSRSTTSVARVDNDRRDRLAAQIRL